MTFDDPAALAMSEANGKILFAGEHTAFLEEQAATVHGGYMSGIVTLQ